MLRVWRCEGWPGARKERRKPGDQRSQDRDEDNENDIEEGDDRNLISPVQSPITLDLRNISRRAFQLFHPNPRIDNGISNIGYCCHHNEYDGGQGKHRRYNGIVTRKQRVI